MNAQISGFWATTPLLPVQNSQFVASSVKLGVDTCVRSLLESSQAQQVTPGGVVLALEAGEIKVCEPFGVLEPGGSKVNADTVYDVASLTKPIATTAIAMKLVGNGVITLDDKVAPFLPEMPASSDICFRHLLGHASGLPAHHKFAEPIAAGDWLGATCPREALLRMVATTQPEREPGSKVVYSDLGYILLGFALERITGDRLDSLIKTQITAPLQMDATRFVDLQREEPLSGNIAPTQSARLVPPGQACGFGRQRIVGQVHDDNAFAAGGICGHAGLFSTASDVATFGAALIKTLHGDETAGFSQATVMEFFDRSAAPSTNWRLGWDTPSPPPAISHAGDRWPSTGRGHLGFTGCSMWLDAARQRVVVLLTNRVYLSHEPQQIRSLRRSVMNRVFDCLDAMAL